MSATTATAIETIKASEFGLNVAQWQLVSQLMDGLGYDKATSGLAKLSGYTTTPPDINTFLDDDMFLGQMLRDKLYPAWRLVLNNVFPNQFYSPYLEVVLSGSVGSGL